MDNNTLLYHLNNLHSLIQTTCEVVDHLYTVCPADSPVAAYLDELSLSLQAANDLRGYAKERKVLAALDS
jgi:hypothetical protein